MNVRMRRGAALQDRCAVETAQNWATNSKFWCRQLYIGICAGNYEYSCVTTPTPRHSMHRRAPFALELGTRGTGGVASLRGSVNTTTRPPSFCASAITRMQRCNHTMSVPTLPFASVASKKPHTVLLLLGIERAAAARARARR